MKKRFLSIGLISLVLVFGMAVSSCDEVSSTGTVKVYNNSTYLLDSYVTMELHTYSGKIGGPVSVARNGSINWTNVPTGTWLWIWVDDGYFDTWETRSDFTVSAGQTKTFYFTGNVNTDFDYF